MLDASDNPYSFVNSPTCSSDNITLLTTVINLAFSFALSKTIGSAALTFVPTVSLIVAAISAILKSAIKSATAYFLYPDSFEQLSETSLISFCLFTIASTLENPSRFVPSKQLTSSGISKLMIAINSLFNCSIVS